MSRPEQVGLVVLVYAVGAAAGTTRPGASLADAGTGLLWGLAALLATAVSVHVVNEYADYDTDARTVRTRFSGGSGALHDLGLQPEVALRAASTSAVLAVAVAGAGLVAGALSPAAVGLLLLGLVGGWQYSVGPLRLSRRGWGEVANAALGGLLLPVYGIAAVTGAATATDAALFVPLSALVLVNLLETQWADRDADRRVGKATLTSRLSGRATRLLAAAATVAGYGALLVLSPAPIPTSVAVASLTAAPFSVWAVVTMTRRREPLPAVVAMVVMVLAQLVAWVVAP